MEAELVLDISKETLLVLLKVALPLLMVALIVGSVVSMLQAITQIQEPTLTFVPKLIAIFVTMLLLMPYMGHVMYVFAEHLSSMMINLE